MHAKKVLARQLRGTAPVTAVLSDGGGDTIASGGPALRKVKRVRNTLINEGATEVRGR